MASDSISLSLTNCSEDKNEDKHRSNLTKSNSLDKNEDKHRSDPTLSNSLDKDTNTILSKENRSGQPIWVSSSLKSTLVSLRGCQLCQYNENKVDLNVMDLEDLNLLNEEFKLLMSETYGHHHQYLTKFCPPEIIDRLPFLSKIVYISPNAESIERRKSKCCCSGINVYSFGFLNNSLDDRSCQLRYEIHYSKDLILGRHCCILRRFPVDKCQLIQELLQCRSASLLFEIGTRQTINTGKAAEYLTDQDVFIVFSPGFYVNFEFHHRESVIHWLSEVDLTDREKCQIYLAIICTFPTMIIKDPQLFG